SRDDSADASAVTLLPQFGKILRRRDHNIHILKSAPEMAAKLRIDFDKGQFLRLHAVPDQLPRHCTRSRPQLYNVRVDAVPQDRCHRPAHKRAGREKTANLPRILERSLPEQNRTLRSLRKIG